MDPHTPSFSVEIQVEMASILDLGNNHALEVNMDSDNLALFNEIIHILL